MNGVSVTNDNGSFHPNQAGEDALGALAAEVVPHLSWPNAEAKNVLTGLTPGQSSAIVAIGHGYEAATYDQEGNVEFWKYPDGGAWKQVGHSTYPVLPPSFGPSDTSMTGALLHGMTDATFIAQGHYSGDGTGSYVSFTNGPRGWGTIAPTGGTQSYSGTTLVPSGANSTDNTTPGEFYFERFFNGGLQVSDPGSLPYGPDGEEWQLAGEFLWKGTAFTASSTNQFVATTAQPPPASAPGVSSCPAAPPDGTYSDFFESASTAMTGSGLFQEPQSVSITLQSDGPSPSCRFNVPPDFPIEVGASDASGHTWITAPAWVLTNGIGGNDDVGDDFPGTLFPGLDGLGTVDYESPDSSPYFIPPSLGISEIDAVGEPVFTVKGGHLASLAIVQPQSS
jgi:hypothetical protein